MTTRVAHITDIHFPYQDVEKLGVATELARGADHIILGGDTIDCYTVSSFEKDPERKATLADECRMAKAWLTDLRKQNPKARISHILGNHELRVRRFLIKRAPELLDLGLITIDKLLGLSELNIEDHPDSGFVEYGWRFKHGDVVAAKSGYTAHKEMEAHNCSGVSGHVHRFCPAFRVTKEGELQQWWEGGGLFDIKQADYISSPNWVNGMIQLHIDPDHIEVEPIFL